MQIAFLKWLFYQHRDEWEVTFKIPNEGKRSMSLASIMRAEGLRAGTPDLMCPVPRGAYHGLFIELKVFPNKPSPAQINMMEKLTKQNYKCIVCYTLEEAITKTTQYLQGV